MNNATINNGQMSDPTKVSRGCSLIIASLLILLLTGCGVEPTEPTAEPTVEPAAPVTSPLAAFFPGDDVVRGWTPGGVEVFDSETIFQLVNGMADGFFAYGFEQVAVRDYENAEGAVLSVEIWQLATPADAYGLFTTSISGEPGDVGNAADVDPGRRLVFWQDRYYVHVRARQTLPDATLRGFAGVIAMALPVGGERPALVDRLPQEGLVERGFVFFHEDISIQNDLWLGGENLLGLSQETDGVLARYEVGGEKVLLMLVRYPNADKASAALKALEAGQVDELVVADVRGGLLGAVFGLVDEVLNEAAAGDLLAEALQ